MHTLPIRGACLGFSSDDQVVSLHVQAANDDEQAQARYSFDIEYDPEEPDQLVLRLLELDQDSFIRAVQRSISFPVGLLADLVNRRKATAEEMADWRSISDEGS